jgi:hypothetical protein
MWFYPETLYSLGNSHLFLFSSACPLQNGNVVRVQILYNFNYCEKSSNLQCSTLCIIAYGVANSCDAVWWAFYDCEQNHPMSWSFCSLTADCPLHCQLRSLPVWKVIHCQSMSSCQCFPIICTQLLRVCLSSSFQESLPRQVVTLSCPHTICWL